MDVMNEDVHRVREAALGALQKLTVGQTELLEGLADCRRQIETQALVQKTVTAAGFQTRAFQWGQDLELYFDIFDNGRDIGYISKGWEDRGFRVAELFTIPLEFAGSLKSRVEDLRQKCATEGIALTTETDDSELTVKLECVIYTAGFNQVSFGNTARYLARCAALVQDSLAAGAADTLTA